MRLINFTEELRGRADDFNLLHEKLQRVFFEAAIELYDIYHKAFLVTSMQRAGSSGVHGTEPCRGIDVDVCDKAVYIGGVLPEEAEYIVRVINGFFRYDPERPWLKVAVYGALDPTERHWNHIHFQVHDRTVAI